MTLNRAELIGNLGRDPESRTTQSGSKVVTFSMATSESWRDKNTGERKERVQWHNIVIFNESLGEIAVKYVKKGDQLFVSGQIETREYTDKDGGSRRVTEIVLRPFSGELKLLRNERRAAPGPDDYGETRTRDSGMKDHAGAGGGARLADQLNDDIPF
jgi:single-strand DNA-binding protein